jgi:hypothetical protein
MKLLSGGRLALALLLVAIAGGATAAPGAQGSGTVLAVVQSANIDSVTGKKVLEPEAPVFSGDRIDTGPVGSAQIRFRDDTKLVVGPNSSMVIDAFVFSDNDTARKISINVVKGAFRFFTGTSPKDAYTITTPTATIGVRGTEFDVQVEGEGTTRVANFEGMTRICHRQPDGTVRDPGKDCIEVKDPCSLSVIRPTEAPLQYSNKDVEFRNRQLKYYFPYVRDQSRLLSDFQVNLTQCQFAGVTLLPGQTTPPGPGPAPPPGIIPPPVPPPPTPPIFIPPTIPPPDFGRHDTRPVYDHGSVFR